VRQYKPILTCAENSKGVLDVDTVKGCERGMCAYPGGGCYGECYARKIAAARGFDFSVSVVRRLPANMVAAVAYKVYAHHARWYRIGVSGDPSHDWGHTVHVCEALAIASKVPVIVTKHWVAASDSQLRRLAAVGVVFNTSTSGMDTNDEIEYRVEQMKRVKAFGMVGVCRVVTCEYSGNSKWSTRCANMQRKLLARGGVIDTPFRCSRNNPRVVSGEIVLTRDARCGGTGTVSLYDKGTYIGSCNDCPDQCGVTEEAR